MSPGKKIENVCLWGTRTLICLIPFLPLYISSSMVFPYITGKNFAFRILVELASVFWIGLITLNRKYRPDYSIILISILTFTFIVGIADILGVDPYKSFWSNYERMEGYITILHLALFFIIIRSVLLTRKDWLLFFNIIITVSLLVSLFSLSLPTATKGTRLWMEYKTRIYGTLGNPPFLAAYMLLSIFIGFITFLNTEKKYLRAYYAVIIFLNAVVIYLTATRGAILSGFLGLLFLSAFYVYSIMKLHKWKSFKKIMIIAVAVCLIAAALTIIEFHKTFELDVTLSRLAAMSSDNSVKARFDAWRMAWSGIKEKPLLGWGQENFIGVYAVNHIPLRREQIWTDRAHNIVIEWLINAGILGLLSYAAIMGSVIYTVLMKYMKKLLSKGEVVTMVTAFIVYVIQNLFTFDTINTYFIFFALIAYIDVIGHGEDRSNESLEENTGLKGTRIKLLCLVLVVLLIYSAVFYFMNYKPICESIRISHISKSASDHKSFSTLLEDLKNILALNTFGDNNVRESMVSISNYLIYNELFSAEGALEFVEETVVEMERGISEHYYNLEYLTSVIILFNRIAPYDPAFIPKAESLIKWSMNINPQYEWLNYALADIYKLKNEDIRMFNILKNMTVLDPHNDQKQLKLALGAIFMKEEKIVRNALEEISRIRGATNEDIALGKTRLEVSDLYLIARAYREVKDYQKVIHYLKELDAKNANSAELHFNLAQAYLNLGDEKTALEEIKKAVKLDPERYGETTKKIIDTLHK